MAIGGESALVRLRERLVCAGSLVLLGGYVALAVFSPTPDVGSVSAGEPQRYVVQNDVPEELPLSDMVFADEAMDAYFDPSVPLRWVQPKVSTVKIEPVRIDLPRPTIPPPPMLLPQPGPSYEYTRDLPRWPEFVGTDAAQ